MGRTAAHGCRAGRRGDRHPLAARGGRHIPGGGGRAGRRWLRKQRQQQFEHTSLLLQSRGRRSGGQRQAARPVRRPPAARPRRAGRPIRRSRRAGRCRAAICRTRGTSRARSPAPTSRSWEWPGPCRSRQHTAGYATTPVVVNGVVYTQDLESNVMAIELATGKVLWRHTYSSPNGGPDGVNVVNGTVYAATNHAAVALSAATGRQLWSRTLIGNNREGIDMAPGYNHGTVYVSTVPVNPTVGRVSGRRQGDPVGAERQDRRAGVELGRGTGPVGQARHQLRRRPVGPAVVRRPGQPLHRRGQPRPAGRRPRLPVGDQPARPGPVHRLGGEAEPAGQAAVVLPAHPARPVRLGSPELAGAHHRPRAAGGDRRRQGRHPDRAQRAHRQAALEPPGGRAQRPRP